jgi:hypothetical protein
VRRFRMQLEYIMCDDWWIMAKDKTGQMYYLSTEFWPEWSEYPKTDRQNQTRSKNTCSPLQKQNGTDWIGESVGRTIDGI